MRRRVARRREGRGWRRRSVAGARAGAAGHRPSPAALRDVTVPTPVRRAVDRSAGGPGPTQRASRSLTEGKGGPWPNDSAGAARAVAAGRELRRGIGRLHAGDLKKRAGVRTALRVRGIRGRRGSISALLRRGAKVMKPGCLQWRGPERDVAQRRAGIEDCCGPTSRRRRWRSQPGAPELADATVLRLQARSRSRRDACRTGHRHRSKNQTSRREASLNELYDASREDAGVGRGTGSAEERGERVVCGIRRVLARVDEWFVEMGGREHAQRGERHGSPESWSRHPGECRARADAAPNRDAAFRTASHRRVEHGLIERRGCQRLGQDFKVESTGTPGDRLAELGALRRRRRARLPPPPVSAPDPKWPQCQASADV